VRRLAGQAARHTGRLLHLLARLAETIAVVTAIAVAVLGWRLAQGPLELPWLTHRVEAAFNEDHATGHVTIGSAALAWEGFRYGVDRPLDVALRDITFADATGQQLLSVPRAEISVSLHALLLGRVVPRALEIDQAHISLIRAVDGSFIARAGGTDATAEADPLLAILLELTHPPTSDRNAIRQSRFSQLRRLRIHDAAIAVEDHQLGVTWRASHADIDLVRGPQGGVDGSAHLSLALGDQQAQVTAAATLPTGTGAIQLHLRTTPVVLAGVAKTLSAVAPLAAVDMPVSGEADLQLTPTLAVHSVHIALLGGSGGVRVADSVVPVGRASLVADATPDHVALRSLRVALPGQPGVQPTIVDISGVGERAADHYSAAVSLTLNEVAFADLAHLWPAGVARGARAWITRNITAGVAHDGHIELGLESALDFSNVTLTRASGTLAGDGLRVSWLAPVPPIEQGSAVLNIIDPDSMEIVIRSGRQAPEKAAQGAGSLILRRGKMRITGIMQPHQFGTIDTDVDGSIPDAVALLRDPRLRLLSKHPLPLDDVAGQVSAHLSVTVPLEAAVSMDDIGIRARAHFQNARIGGIVAGRDLDRGTLDLDASTEGMTITGQADLAGIPARIDAAMDFRAGGPRQVLQRVVVQGRATTAQLALNGLDIAPIAAGTIGLAAILSEHRDGSGELAVGADLAGAELSVAPLGWHKPAGSSARAAARLVLSHDRLTAIEDLALEGDGLSASGSISCVDGKPAVIQLDRLVLGRSEARGTIRLPMADEGGRRGVGPIAVTVSGPSIDLSSNFDGARPPLKAKPKPEQPSGPHWILDARFDRVIMAGDRALAGVSARLDSDGGIIHQLRVDGRTGATAPFEIEIASTGNRRSLHLTAADGGATLAAVADIDRIEGGHLTVNGSYNDAELSHPLSGTLELTDFRVRDAPVMARLLQGMTLYGLLDTMRGPGLGFSRLVMPFTLANNTLTVRDVRAFSPSLGITIRGAVDFDLRRADLEGTIVPAYFFNALLGNIPLVGRLFSPERGGGVFAASYAVHGPLRDPAVTVNPLAALTPGFLRGLFGVF
jgi:hypothetical protein